jgi:hypothetical protein
MKKMRNTMVINKNLSEKIIKNQRILDVISLGQKDKISAGEKSWRCCKSNDENYNNPEVCSACGHVRCGNCKDLFG